MEVLEMLDDNREIIKIMHLNGDIKYAVGLNCTAIRVYREPGQGAYVPWLAVYDGKEIKFRLPPVQFVIEYADEFDK